MGNWQEKSSPQLAGSGLPSDTLVLPELALSLLFSVAILWLLQLLRLSLLSHLPPCLFSQGHVDASL